MLIGAALLLAVIGAVSLAEPWRREIERPDKNSARSPHPPPDALQDAGESPASGRSLVAPVEASREEQPVLSPASSVLEQRVEQLQIPDGLLGADEYAACVTLNPEGAPLNAEERRTLDGILSQGQLELEAARHRALEAVHAWAVEKAEVEELSAKPGTAQAAGLSELARSHGHMIRQVVHRDGRKRVVSIGYGEDASVDVGFDELWASVSHAQARIRTFFSERRE